jgi:FPC/CPF motif-containing protein YcgG
LLGEARLRWLGLHQMSAYGEYKNIEARQYMFRDAVVSNHAWSSLVFNSPV